MKGFVGNIEEITLLNEYFREVLFTGAHCQLVVMSLKPLEEIGMEVHPDNDQFFRFEKGEGKVIIDGEEHKVGNGTALVIPAGANHNIIYAPAHHPDGTVHPTKKDALESEESEH